MRVAVTGATGFVGRQVISQLVRHDVEVIAVVRPDSCARAEHGQTIKIDLARPPQGCFAQLGEPDCLIHLAWAGLPNYRSPHHFETELPLHYGFIKHLVGEGLGNVTVAGTCFEYGNQSGPLAEDLICQPDNAYGYAKNCLRQQLEFLQRDQYFNLTWARLFYLHGEGQPGNSLFPKLQHAVTSGQRQFDMSSGEQLRDYLPIETAANLLSRLALLQRDLGVVNVCSGQPVSVRNLVETWLAEYSWSMELNFGKYPYPDYEPLAFWGDRRKLDSILGPE